MGGDPCLLTLLGGSSSRAMSIELLRSTAQKTHSAHGAAGDDDPPDPGAARARLASTLAWRGAHRGAGGPQYGGGGRAGGPRAGSFGGPPAPPKVPPPPPWRPPPTPLVSRGGRENKG